MNDCDIAIVGAGPYGLASAAHLGAADSFRITAFGETMSFWSEHMPVGMLLRSPYVACNISDPADKYSLPMYERAIGEAPVKPVPLSRFVAYGHWVQQHVMPDLVEERIVEVSRNGSGFYITRANGERVHAGRVVVAAGICDFARYPEVFQNLPHSLVSHACEHDDLTKFKGANVLVVGAGQSALESAALLSEAGAHVEVVVREPVVNWLTRRWHHKLGPVSKLLYAWPDVGPAGISRMVALPDLFRSTPRKMQTWMTRKALRPAGSGWLPPRLGEVKITVGITVTEASDLGGRIRVGFDDGSTREADHVLLGTGYEVDVTKYPFLSQGIKDQVETANGYPVLGRGFESSVSGLHFMGAPAAWSFGPLMRFVAGTTFAGAELAGGILAKTRKSK